MEGELFQGGVLMHSYLRAVGFSRITKRSSIRPVSYTHLDYIILDCPPSLNMLTINALTAATSVLVPIQCEYYALEGLSQLIHTIDLVKERLNKRCLLYTSGLQFG